MHSLEVVFWDCGVIHASAYRLPKHQLAPSLGPSALIRIGTFPVLQVVWHFVRARNENLQ